MTVSYDGNTLLVTYTIIEGYFMNESHLFASAALPDTIAPGQYGNMHDLDLASTDTYELSLSGSPLYLIAYAVVGYAQ